MDKKVLEVLINRVEDSSCNYTIHKNKEWKDCLKRDKGRLINYILKNDNALPDSFKFIANGDLDSELIYTASKSSENDYLIVWYSNNRNSYEEMYYTKSEVIRLIENGNWNIIEKDIF